MIVVEYTDLVMVVGLNLVVAENIDLVKVVVAE